MGLFDRIFGRTGPDLSPLYSAVVDKARRPEWYLRGGAQDTLDGRFEVLALVMARVLLRFERDGATGAAAAARLTENFVADMDGQLRETGYGDLGVGKQVGKQVGALGGRLGSYRDGITRDALVRNLWRGEDQGVEAHAAVAATVRDLDEGLAALALDQLIEGRLR